MTGSVGRYGTVLGRTPVTSNWASAQSGMVKLESVAAVGDPEDDLPDAGKIEVQRLRGLPLAHHAAAPEDLIAVPQDLELGAAFAGGLIVDADRRGQTSGPTVESDDQHPGAWVPKPLVNVCPFRVSGCPSTDRSAWGLPQPCVAWERSREESQTVSSARVANGASVSIRNTPARNRNFISDSGRGESEKALGFASEG